MIRFGHLVQLIQKVLRVDVIQIVGMFGAKRVRPFLQQFDRLLQFLLSGSQRHNVAAEDFSAGSAYQDGLAARKHGERNLAGRRGPFMRGVGIDEFQRSVRHVGCDAGAGRERSGDVAGPSRRRSTFSSR